MIVRSIIDGKEIDGTSKSIVVGPWGDDVCEISLVEGREILRSAVDSAAQYDPLTPPKVIELFNKLKQRLKDRKSEYIDALVKESGKTKSMAEGEFDAVLARLDFASVELSMFDPIMIDGNKGYHTQNKVAYIIREPYGVMLAVTPFNYPLLAAILKVIPGLLAGNSVILKPSTLTPLSSYMLVMDLLEVGFPKESIQLLITRGSEMDHILKDSRVKLVSFTGSSKVGWKMREKYPIRKYILELGGKGNALVLDDKDLDMYADEIAKGAFKFSGQRCDALSRVIVLSQFKEKLIEKLVEKAKEYTFGNKIVPLITQDAYIRAIELKNEALLKGAKVLFEGKHNPEKNYIEPVILDGVTPEMAIYYEEVFGPILSIITVDSEEEAIAIANDNIYGLDSAVFCGDLELAMRVAEMLDDGEVTINGHPQHGIAYFPYGGHKLSGVHSEGIFRSIEEMTLEKTIVIKRPKK